VASGRRQRADCPHSLAYFSSGLAVRCPRRFRFLLSCGRPVHPRTGVRRHGAHPALARRRRVRRASPTRLPDSRSEPLESVATPCRNLRSNVVTFGYSPWRPPPLGAPAPSRRGVCLFRLADCSSATRRYPALSSPDPDRSFEQCCSPCTRQARRSGCEPDYLPLTLILTSTPSVAFSLNSNSMSLMPSGKR
jgi:hypothetical protein